MAYPAQTVAYPQPTIAMQAPVVQQPIHTIQPVHTAVMTGTRPTRQQRDWSTGLCDCQEDASSCMLVGVCAVCYGCHLSAKAGDCCGSAALPGWFVALRAYTRGKYNIKGSIAGDCITTMCCYPCAMCQLSREIDNINEGLTQ